MFTDYFEDRDIEWFPSGSKNVSRGWVGIKCVFPFCGDPSSHLGINKRSKAFKCHYCGEKGHIVQIIQEIEQCSWSKASSIYKRYEEDTDFSIPEEKRFTNKVLLPNCERTFPKLHLDYLYDERKFDPYKLIDKYKIKACYTTGELNYTDGEEERSLDLSYRIIIPFFLQRRLVTFTSRSIIEDPKIIPYIHSPIVNSILDPKSTLYNLNTVKQNGVVVIVEGVFDVWRIGDGCVAAMGKDLTLEQIQLLLPKNPKKIYIVLDSDAKDRAEAMRITLSSIFPKNTVEVIGIQKGDPCELPVSDVRIIKRLIIKG